MHDVYDENWKLYVKEREGRAQAMYFMHCNVSPLLYFGYE